MPENSIDSIVTDPPYNLSFMGKAWDKDSIAFTVDFWKECLRVLKPGGHVLAFGGTRTYHRLTCAIEDAGFEIRDCLHWLYGSGFPKSLDVSKAIDKRGGAMPRLAEFRNTVKAAMKQSGVTRSDLQAALGNFMLSHYLSDSSQPAIPTPLDYRVIRDALNLDAEWDDVFLPEAPREHTGRTTSTTGKRLTPLAESGFGNPENVNLETAPATDNAKKWSGWGTALKPAVETIVLARKPLDQGTVAANVLAWGTGALNIDGCRIGTNGEKVQLPQSDPAKRKGTVGTDLGITKANPEAFRDAQRASIERTNTLGRWPANLLLSHSMFCTDEACDQTCAVKELDTQSGQSKSPEPGYSTRRPSESIGTFGTAERATMNGFGDKGGASRFFYVAKPSGSEKHAAIRNTHATVKPVTLMRYLCRLITPPGGTLLDPFAGSGTTGVAALAEGFHPVLIEREAEYVAIIRARLEHTEAA